ncbi:MAG: apolipoprotein N-acyltransferase, partial [Pseudomonadota bacterium]
MKSFFLRSLLAITSGLLLTTAFPKIDWSCLAWVAYIPLFASINNQPPRTSFWLGFIAGIFHYTTLIYWIANVCHNYGGLPQIAAFAIMLLLAGYLSLYTATLAFLVSACKAKDIDYPISAPVILVSLEFLRSIFLTGFPWAELGHSQYQNILLVQSADIFGAYGVSALIIGVNAALFVAAKNLQHIRKTHLKPLTIMLILISLFYLYGTIRIRGIDAASKSAPKSNIMIIQGNIDQSLKWNPVYQISTIKKYIDMTLAAQDEHTDLIVWPETAMPFYFSKNLELTELVNKGTLKFKAPLLTGSPACIQGKEGEYRYY